ncbi:hypothetical protein [Aequorivita vladivostokensis]|uniref:Uncharacterized protein n=1 Tax=Aequorivita vladivostokensis TaxID=171194 RepID=A0ABR5DKK2_9FLAO|nr:hypothetical protein [Aequorivita vladivostokensis]KJJ39311.1 hypothetical protein MB09_03445 [Aequorivita vladivostokensis]
MLNSLYWLDKPNKIESINELAIIPEQPMKILNVLMITIISILCLMSILALISIHGKVFGMASDFSPKGIDTYLSAYLPNKYLLTLTIATCSAYFGLLRVKATLDSNIEKIKQDRFSEWTTIVQIRCNEIALIDPKMTREIIRVRRAIFNFLFDKDFNIKNVGELTELFNKNIAESVGFFETTNSRHHKYGGIYRNDKHSYSFDSFRFIFYGMLENWYDEMIDDLENLYIANLQNGRMISEGHYQATVKSTE